MSGPPATPGSPSRPTRRRPEPIRAPPWPSVALVSPPPSRIALAGSQGPFRTPLRRGNLARAERFPIDTRRTDGTQAGRSGVEARRASTDLGMAPLRGTGRADRTHALANWSAREVAGQDSRPFHRPTA